MNRTVFGRLALLKELASFQALYLSRHSGEQKCRTRPLTARFSELSTAT
jgi:hypothetical protein